jgi:hypothetical protein
LRLRLTRKRVFLFIAALALVVVGGVGYAAVAADTGAVYSACKLKATGTIRLLDASAPSTSLLSHCTTYETAFSFNEKGQPGTDGINGINGIKGTDGTNGTNGVSGYERVYGAFVTATGGGPQVTSVASCTQGKKAIGGGWDWFSFTGPTSVPPQYIVLENGTTANSDNTWNVSMYTHSGANTNIVYRALAICANT